MVRQRELGDAEDIVERRHAAPHARAQSGLELDQMVGHEPGGKYDMATLALDASTRIAPQTVRALVREAVALNRKLGDPTDI